MINCFECENSTPNGECRIGTIEKCPKLRDFWIMDTETGEEFFVECIDETECWGILANEFDHIDRFKIVDIVTPTMAEIIGLDTL